MGLNALPSRADSHYDGEASSGSLVDLSKAAWEGPWECESHMRRSAHLPRIAAFLLAGVLYPHLGLASASAQFGVHLVIHESCEVRTDPGSAARAPAVNCRHGQSFAVSRHGTEESPASPLPAARTLTRATADGAATEMWVVTF